MLDETLQQCNTRYRTKRAGDMGMVRPRILELPAGTFYRWRRERCMLGDPQKVPRVTSDRAVADGLLTLVTARGREPLVHPSPKVYRSVILL